MQRRMPAEWENPKTIFLALPNHTTDWNYILEEALSQYHLLINSLLKGGEKIWLLTGSHSDNAFFKQIDSFDNITLINAPYNDTWTRDYGFITVEDEGKLKYLDFGFNGWGLKFAADKDNLINLNLKDHNFIPESGYCNHRDFILEGGSIESDGKGTILTTSRCLCSPNRNGGKTKDELEPILARLIGAKRVLWIDYGFLEGDDTDSHIDTLARLAPGDTIVYTAPPENKAEIHYEELSKMESQLKSFVSDRGVPYSLIPLPLPDPIYDEEGQRLPATYANYLVTQNNVFIPTYSQPENDACAVEAISKAFPHHKVFTVDCRTLIKQHGSLHCSTMQLYF